MGGPFHVREDSVYFIDTSRYRMPSEFQQYLPPLLRALIAGPLAMRDTERLVRLAVTRTEEILFWMRRRKNYRFQAIGLSHRDLAYDMTAELFTEAGDIPCAALRLALLPHAEGTDDDLLSVLDAVLIRTVSRQFSRVFADVNPEYHLLMKALRQYVARTPDIETMDMLDGRWYLFGGRQAAMLHLPAMPVDELHRSLAEVDPRNRSEAIEIFRLVGLRLTTQDHYRRAVCESDVVRIALEYVGGSLAAEQRHDAEQRQDAVVESDSHDATVLSHTVQRAVENVRVSLERSYVERNRLTREEFELVLSAVRTSFLDVAKEDEERSGFMRLRQFMPGLTSERYHETYRRKYAYMRELVMQEAQRLLHADGHALS